MSRVKPEAVKVLKDLDEVNDALREIAGLDRQLGLVEADMNRQIDEVKGKAERRSEPLRAAREVLVNGLQAYMEYHRAELFQTRKSVELQFGTIGSRLTRSLKPRTKWTWARVLGALKEAGVTDAVRLKEEVDREVLERWPDERLAEVGVTRATEDKVWFEIKTEALDDRAP